MRELFFFVYPFELIFLKNSARDIISWIKKLVKKNLYKYTIVTKYYVHYCSIYIVPLSYTRYQKFTTLTICKMISVFIQPCCKTRTNVNSSWGMRLGLRGTNDRIAHYLFRTEACLWAQTPAFCRPGLDPGLTLHSCEAVSKKPKPLVRQSPYL